MNLEKLKEDLLATGLLVTNITKTNDNIEIAFDNELSIDLFVRVSEKVINENEYSEVIKTINRDANKHIVMLAYQSGYEQGKLSLTKNQEN